MPETDAELSEKERTMARQLVESLAVEGFDPQKYHDEYREQLLDLIARKESGADIVAEPQTEPPAKVLDLVAALEASIAKSKTAKDRHPTGAATRAAARRRSRRGQADEVDGQDREGARRRRRRARSAAPDRRERTDARRGGPAQRPAAGGQVVHDRVRGVLVFEPAAAGADRRCGEVGRELRAGLPPGADGLVFDQVVEHAESVTGG